MDDVLQAVPAKLVRAAKIVHGAPKNAPSFVPQPSVLRFFGGDDVVVTWHVGDLPSVPKYK